MHNEILEELSKKNNYDNLTYHPKGKNISFNNFDNVFSFLKKIRDGDNVRKGKKKKLKWMSGLNEMKKRRNTSKDQKRELHNIKTLCKARNSFITFFDDYILQWCLILNMHQFMEKDLRY